MHRLLRFTLRQVLPPLLVFVLATAALQIYVQAAHVPKYKMASPKEIWKTLVEERSELAVAFWTTTQATLIGFGCSAAIGLTIAIVLAASPVVRRAIYPYTVFFQTVPIVAIAPFLVIWFEAGLASVSICAFIVSVFPVIAGALSGLLSTDPPLVDLFQLYGAGPFDRLWKLRLPYALPSIMTGLRVAAGLAVIGAVVGEFLVGTLGDAEGLGVKIVSAMKYGRTDRAFAAVLLASLLGLILFGAVNLASYLMLRRWHASERDS